MDYLIASGKNATDDSLFASQKKEGTANCIKKHDESSAII